MADLSLFDLTGKKALVTGGAVGIGRACAVALATAGADVAIVDIDAKAGRKTSAEIKALRRDSMFVSCDVTSKPQVQAMVNAVVRRFKRLDIAVNNAGIAILGADEELEQPAWDKVIAVNLTGTFLMCQAAIPHILKTKGAIINTASVAGLKSHPYSAAYCASKGGVVLLTKALAVEYGRKEMRINCICPGGIETPLINEFKLPDGVSEAALVRISPLGRMGLPAEVAGTIAFLASADAAYINGSAIVVDGGMIA